MQKIGDRNWNYDYIYNTEIVVGVGYAIEPTSKILRISVGRLG